MWSFRVVVFPPFFDQGLRFTQAVEDFAVPQLIAEPGVEAFAIPVLPWAASFDVRGLCTDGFDPVLDGLNNELWAIARTDKRRDAAQDEQVAQHINYIARVQLAIHAYSQAFSTILVDDVERPERFPVVGAAMHKVV